MSSLKDEDIFKIMLATDCHLGYLESDPIRGNDSLVAFEEILQLAVEQEVDMILLAGDLFHENKPSRKVMHNCMSLLRKYCMGDRPVQFEFLSDQSENFRHSSYPIVNFEDPNLNVSTPVFSIHGNHDDPAGSGSYCSLDLLSVSGLVNYFGKSTDLENISISPLMLQKGKTKLCLYGLGSIRDERLHRMFLDGKVSMLRPKEKCEEWFNVMVIHQNRAKHGLKNYIPEQFLDDFLDLVVWGHEHECRIDQEWNDTQSFYVTQPGSSVATSLCQGEAVKKHVGILQIKGKEFEITKLPLQTVRQFYIKDVDLEETSLNLHSPDSQEKVMEYCNELVDQFLEKAEEEHSGDPKQPKQPLVRLRIFYPHTFDPFSVHRFGHSYVSKVANNKDILLFSRKKTERLKGVGIDDEMLANILKQDGVERRRVEDLVKKYFEQTDENMRLLVISEVGVSSAVQEYVDKDVKEAISTIVNHQLNKTQNHLKGNVTEAENINDQLVKFREERKRNSKNETTEFQVIMKTTHISKKNSNNSDDNLFDDEMGTIPNTKRGRGRGARGGRGSTSNRANSSAASKRTTSRAAKNDDEENSTKRRRVNNPTRSSRQTEVSSFFQSSTLDDTSDNDLEGQRKSRKKTSAKNNTSSRRGVNFDFSD